jgi:hypothetical protein
MSDEARDLLQQLLAEIRGNGHAPTPQVPAPPVAAVLRPSTWSQPPAPGEVIGDGAMPSARVEPVRIDSDAALAAFVQTVLARADEIRAGALSFTLGQAPASSGVVRVDRGAVTERIVKQAADAGARLVLAPRAVITPLAREKARALGVEIERER